MPTPSFAPLTVQEALCFEDACTGPNVPPMPPTAPTPESPADRDPFEPEPPFAIALEHWANVERERRRAKARAARARKKAQAASD